MNVFLNCKKEYGFNMDLSYVVDVTCQLNILEKKESKFVFAHQSYQDYFYSEYEKMILGI